MLGHMVQSPIALLLAAGLGKRMKSERAKMLHEIAGRPLIAWSVETARAAGASRIVAVLGHQHELVSGLLDGRFGAGAVEVALQLEQRGTGHAVMSALPALANEPDDRTVVILTGDAPLFPAARVQQLVDGCARSAAGLALVSAQAPARPGEPLEGPAAAYGRLVRHADGRLARIVEARDATEAERAIAEVNAGFYAVRLGLLRAEVGALTADNAQGELYLTDLAARAAERGSAVVIEAAFDEIRGINDRVELAEVDALARRAINRAWMEQGVSFAAPDHAYVDADVGPIGADTWIGPGVALRGRTRAGARCRIDVGCVLTDVTLADDVEVKPYSVLRQTEVGDRAQVGPFTHCRPGTRLEEEVHLGNFAETKNTHLMVGAKSNHVSYLGDTSIGARANIGAGTIVCNYDGVSKHRTVIEAGAFVGSDSQLVAPVTVGRDAYVGSGTTVTRDVPRGSLALSRVKQVNVEGWADRFREAQSKRKGR
jgi:bifunctional UDP-N-acetylglucosamine pyrophosphorylase/glucosamine-1-phosphate N-acetyltransferase